MLYVDYIVHVLCGLIHWNSSSGWEYLTALFISVIYPNPTLLRGRDDREHESMVKVTPDQTFPCEREREVWELGMTLLVLVCALALFTRVEETWEWGCMQVHAILQEVLDHAPLPAVDVVGTRLGTVPFGDSKCSLILMHAASLPIFQGEQG